MAGSCLHTSKWSPTWGLVGVCHSPVDFYAHSHAYPRSLSLVSAHADAQLSTGE